MMATTLTPATLIVVSKEQVSANLSGEAVILGMKDGVYYGLDPIGARVWALVQEPLAVGRIADAIVAEYDVTRDRVLADLLTLASQLVECGLVEVVPAPAA